MLDVQGTPAPLADPRGGSGAAPTPLPARRRSPWLIVEVDGTPGSSAALVWALREAARREATVIAVHVLGDDGGASAPFGRRPPDDLDRIEAEVHRAVAETGVHGRTRTATLERPVFEALTGAAHGADLVVVGPHGKALLRHAVPRPPARRLARGA